MSGRAGFLRRAYEAAIDFALRKEHVGTDKIGNKYYRYFEKVEGVKNERREVKWADPYIFYDPNKIPSEWRMWLRKLRQEPPTEEELQQSAVKAATLAARVAALDEADRMRRLRQQGMGTAAQHAGQQADTSAPLQEPSGGPSRQHQQQQQQAQAQHAQAQQAKAQQQPQQQAGEGTTTFTPETWRPGR